MFPVSWYQKRRRQFESSGWVNKGDVKTNFLFGFLMELAKRKWPEKRIRTCYILLAQEKNFSKSWHLHYGLPNAWGRTNIFNFHNSQFWQKQEKRGLKQLKIVIFSLKRSGSMSHPLVPALCGLSSASSPHALDWSCHSQYSKLHRLRLVLWCHTPADRIRNLQGVENGRLEEKAVYC